MRACVQRVSRARVVVDEATVGQIGTGLLVLLGVAHGDTEDEARELARKIVGLRVFDDDEGKMNLALADIAGSVLVVSQFTLLADCRRGRRPSYTEAAPPAEAERLYQIFVREVGAAGLSVETGQFRAHMEVDLTNDGPVTLWLDTRAQ